MTEDILLQIAIWVLAFLLGIFLTRWIFKIDKIFEHLQSQTFELKMLRRLVYHQMKKEGFSDEYLQELFDKTRKEVY